jgi:hypothetical protein
MGMGKLTGLLQDDARREALIADFVEMVEEHVADRGGLRGMTLRAGLSAVQRKLPDAIPRTITRLLPEFLEALEPLRAQSKAASGAEFARHLKRDPERVAEAMLGIADARVERSTNAGLKKFYARFRSTAENEAEEIVPGLADVLARHL